MTKEELQLKASLVLAENTAKGFEAKRCIDRAVELMLDGYQLEELDILAGLDNTESREAELYFAKAIEKLGLQIEKDEEKLLTWFAKDIAQKVVNGEMSPLKGQEILTKIYYELDYFPDYSNIVYADDYWYVELCNGAKPEGYEDYVLNEFKEFLKEVK